MGSEFTPEGLIVCQKRLVQEAVGKQLCMVFLHKTRFLNSKILVGKAFIDLLHVHESTHIKPETPSNFFESGPEIDYMQIIMCR